MPAVGCALPRITSRLSSLRVLGVDKCSSTLNGRGSPSLRRVLCSSLLRLTVVFSAWLWVPPRLVHSCASPESPSSWSSCRESVHRRRRPAPCLKSALLDVLRSCTVVTVTRLSARPSVACKLLTSASGRPRRDERKLPSHCSLSAAVTAVPFSAWRLVISQRHHTFCGGGEMTPTH